MDTDKPAHGGRPMTLGEVARDEDRQLAKAAEEELPKLTQREIVWASYYELRSAVEQLEAAASALQPELVRHYRSLVGVALDHARRFRDIAERDGTRRERAS